MLHAFTGWRRLLQPGRYGGRILLSSSWCGAAGARSSACLCLCCSSSARTRCRWLRTSNLRIQLAGLSRRAQLALTTLRRLCHRSSRHTRLPNRLCHRRARHARRNCSWLCLSLRSHPKVLVINGLPPLRLGAQLTHALWRNSPGISHTGWRCLVKSVKTPASTSSSALACSQQIECRTGARTFACGLPRLGLHAFK